MPCNTKEVYCAERKFTSQLGANSGLELPCDQFHTQRATARVLTVCEEQAPPQHMMMMRAVWLLAAARGSYGGVLALYWFCVGW